MENSLRTTSVGHEIKAFFDAATSTLTYIVWDTTTLDAVIIDPVLGFETSSSEIKFESAELLRNFIQQKNLMLFFILETHIHADHLSSAHVLKQWYPSAQTAIGQRICEVQEGFAPKISDKMNQRLECDGSQFDRLLKDFEVFQAGSLTIKAIPTRGHTPTCMSYLIGDSLFTGDALLMPDAGTGRCDFPGGSSMKLYDSIVKNLYTLPDSTQVFIGHDYQPNGRELRFRSTIGQQKANNIQISSDTSREAFIELRTQRDKTLCTPRLFSPSIEVNISAGQLVL